MAHMDQPDPRLSPLVDLRGLGKRYGAFDAVKNLSFHISGSELFALLGPNGAGKTTTLRMLMGILRPTSGAALVRGLDCFADRAEVKRCVGYLPDQPSFYDYLRGGEIVRFVGEMHGLDRARIEARAGELMTRFELTDAAGEYAVNYSLGMKKKLAFVCALIHDPELLILDEPTSGLDPYAIRTVHETMRELCARGKTILYSTHLLAHAEKISTRVGIMSGGTLAAVGTLEELRARGSGDRSLEEIFFSVTGPHPEGV